MASSNLLFRQSTWRIFSSGSSELALPGLLPRLVDTLQNIPPIKVRLPFGLLEQPSQNEQQEISGLGKHGQRDVATPNDHAIPPRAGITVMPPPSFFTDNNGLVLAVPKKKVSHQKKRQRQLAGNKQLKELRSLNRCPSCGHVKRMHSLCMNCVSEIKQVFKERERDLLEAQKSAEEKQVTEDISKEDERVIYPGKYLREEEEKLRNKEYIYRPPRSLPFEK